MIVQGLYRIFGCSSTPPPVDVFPDFNITSSHEISMVVGSTTLVGISSLKKGSSECIVIGIQNPGIIFSLFVSSLFMDCIQSMTRSLDSFFCEQNSIHGKDTYPLQSFSPRQEIDIEVRRNFWAVQKGNMAVCLGSPVEV